MKLFVVFCVFLTVACTSALSVSKLVSESDGTIYNFELPEGSVGNRDRYVLEPEGVEAGTVPQIRQRRVTCDVLSFATLWITVNDAACATRCLTQGRKGGRCQDGVCVCR